MKRRQYSIILIIFSIFCIISCKSTQIKDSGTFIWLTDNSRFYLLPPENIQKHIDGFQFLSASFGEQDFYANVWVIADDSGIDMVLMNEMGANMGELVWREGELSFSSNIFPAALPPEYIISDFQFCFYKISALNSALEKTGISVRETDEGRRVSRNENVIIDITIKNDIVILLNHLRGYTFTLEGDFR